MSRDVSGIITWIRTFLDDVYAPKGSGGSDLDIDLVPKSENENGVICFSGGLTYDLDKVYPIGSIYMSVNSANPSTLFGGTWVQLTDTFLYATSTTADADSTTSTGGEATHTLTENEMPSHTHKQNPHHHDLNRNWSVNSGSNTAYMTTQNRTYASVNTKDTTATNQNTGGGQAHNNMPPYMKVYMWKRTA